MTAYKISNINGRFDHIRTKRAALQRIAEIERQAVETEDDARALGWTIRRITAAQARAVGLSPGRS